MAEDENELYVLRVDFASRQNSDIFFISGKSKTEVLGKFTQEYFDERNSENYKGPIKSLRFEKLELYLSEDRAEYVIGLVERLKQEHS